MAADPVPQASERAVRGRGVATNSTSQLLSFVFRALSGIGVVVLVARDDGPHGLGIVQFALTLTSLLPFFYGVPALLAREVARRPDDGRRWIETGTWIALLFGGLFTLALPAGAALLGAAPSMVTCIGLASLGMAFDGIARVQFAAFWAWERMELETVVTFGQETAYVVGTAVALSLGGGPDDVLAVFAASRGLGAVWGWLLVGHHLGRLPLPHAQRGTLWPTVRQCTPFAASDTLTLTYARFDSVMLGLWKGSTAVGLYQAATNLVLYFNVVGRSVNRALYPRMGRAWPTRPEEFRRLRDLSLRLVAIIAVPITVGSLLVAPRTIHFLYGHRFAAAVLTYQLLIVVIPIRMAGQTMSQSLAATDHQKARTIAVAGAAALNLGLNCYFIPRWSYLGAAMTTVICETGVLLAYALILRAAAGPSELFRANGWPLLACVPMAAAVLLTEDRHLLVSVAAGAAAYAVALMGLAVARAGAEGRRRPGSALARLVEPVT